MKTPAILASSSAVPPASADAALRDAWAAALAILVFWAATAAIWPLTGSVVPWDSKNHFYPMLRYLSTALEHGELPLWNPYHFSGHPAVADPQSLLFNPTMLLFAWAVPSPSMQLFDLAVYAHFLPGALAMVLLFRRRGWHPAGAVIAAMIFILGGSASARLQHTGMIFSYGWFPVALWLLEEALDRRSYRHAILFGVVGALMTVGRDQVAFLFALALIAVAVTRTATAPRSLSYLASRAGVFAAMGAIGAALLAVPTVLTMQFLATSTRPGIGYGVAAMGSLPPSSLATALFGDVFGSLRWTYDYWGPDWNTVPEGTWTDRATNYLFAGTIPALLILWHGLAGGRLFAREVRFFAVTGLVAVLYALGRYTPVFDAFFDFLPGVNLYRRPADATFLINVVLALCTGYLVHRFVRDGAPRIGWTGSLSWRLALTGLSAALFAGAVGVALLYAGRAGKLPEASREIAIGLAIVAAAALLLRREMKPGRRAAIAALLVGVTGAELAWRNAASPLNAEPASRYAVFQQLPPEQLQGLQTLKAELAQRHARGDRPRVEILGLTGAWQNASMVLGLEDTIGYNPLRLADYERAVGPGENAADPNLRKFPSSFRGYKCRLANLLGLEYLVIDRPAEKLPAHFPRLGDAKLLYGSGAMWIYRLNPTAPRAYLATRLQTVDSEAALDQDELPEFDRAHEALIEEASIEDLKGDYGFNTGVSPEPARSSVRIASYGVNQVVLDVETDRAGVVVLHDIYYPGWTVTVGGEEKPILRTNLLFRGVEVGAGRHRVEFTFRPLSVGNLVSAAAGLIATDDEAAVTD